jgi:hypothetical protein
MTNQQTITTPKIIISERSGAYDQKRVQDVGSKEEKKKNSKRVEW